MALHKGGFHLNTFCFFEDLLFPLNLNHSFLHPNSIFDDIGDYAPSTSKAIRDKEKERYREKERDRERDRERERERERERDKEEEKRRHSYFEKPRADDDETVETETGNSSTISYK